MTLQEEWHVPLTLISFWVSMRMIKFFFYLRMFVTCKFFLMISAVWICKSLWQEKQPMKWRRDKLLKDKLLKDKLRKDKLLKRQTPEIQTPDETNSWWDKLLTRRTPENKNLWNTNSKISNLKKCFTIYI